MPSREPINAVEQDGVVAFQLPAVAHQPLTRSVIGSVLTGVLGQAALVVSGVLVARMLSVHDRGAVALALVFVLILVQLGTLGVPRAVTFEVARAGGSAGSVLSTAIPVAVAQTLGILGIGAVAALLLSTSRPDIGIVAFLALAYAPVGVVMQYGLATLQGLGSFRAFNVIRLAPGVIYAVFALIAFALGGANVPLVIIASVSANVIAAAFVVVQVRRELRTERATGLNDRARPQTTGSLLWFGMRSLVGSLSPLGSMGVDQLIVGLALSPATLGLYVVASSISNLPRFLAQSFGLVAYPHLASLSGGAQAEAIVRLLIVVSVVGGLVILALELAAGAIIPFFFGPAYSEAVPVARILLLSAFLFGLGRILSDSLQGAGQPLAGTVSEAIALLTLALLLGLLWESLDAFRFAIALTFAAGAGLLTLAIIAFLRIGRTGDGANSVAPPV